MKRLFYVSHFLILSLLSMAGCSKDDEQNTLSVNQTTINFGSNGGSLTVTIQTDARTWNLTNSLDWLTVSNTSGSGKSATVTLTVNTRTLEPRAGTLIVSAGSATPVELTITQIPSDFLYVITTDATSLNFAKDGEPKSLKITTDAPIWNISANVEWLSFNKTSGTKGVTTLTITATKNSSDDPRTATISITAADAVTIEIPVTQKGSLYPNYNTSPIEPDATGMSSDAVALAAKINLGWNLGNTLEAIGGETAWGNPKTTKALIDLVKANGFNAVRLPCSWNQNLESNTTAKIKTDWLNRVKEVIQYCVDNDMYVLLNIHWDGGWLENNCTPEKQEENNAKQKAFWQQIATHMRDFDEHLLFASANEPNVENATQMTVLNSYHQTFIEAVRSTGGRNSYRVLVVQGPSTDIEKTNTLMNTLPLDEIEKRMMVEIHYYTPYQFCLMTEDASWGKMFYYWGVGHHSATDLTRNATWGEENDVNNLFGLMKTKFVDKGIPVVMGEYAAIRRTTLTGDNLTTHLAARTYYLKYVTQKALENGFLPFYWDAGGLGNHGSGLFNRQDNTVFDQPALDALLEAAE